jgi:hypothetical protein
VAVGLQLMAASAERAASMLPPRLHERALWLCGGAALGSLATVLWARAQRQPQPAAEPAAAAAARLSRALACAPGRRLTLHEIETLALPLLASFVREYYQYTAGGGQTASHSTAAFEALVLVPRILVGVSQCDISTTLFGARWGAPIAVAPTTFHCLAHPRGEAATARGAAAAGCNYCCASCLLGAGWLL